MMASMIRCGDCRAWRREVHGTGLCADCFPKAACCPRCESFMHRCGCLPPEPRDLGRLVGQVLRIERALCEALEDPYTVACSEEALNARLCRSAEREVHALVRAAGFRDFAAFLEVVEQRTSPRWVYFQGLGQWAGEAA